jgi:cell filamentation protein
VSDGYKYNYDDPDHLYVDRATGVLYNKLGIQDDATLQTVEGIESARRIEELDIRPIKIKSASSLLTIHEHIFQDLYNWAGRTRKVNISKQGKPFLPMASFAEGFTYIDSLIGEYRASGNDKQTVARGLAAILDSVNYLHPFREGNGRTQREFVRTLALEKGYALNLNPIDDKSVYERYMTGTIEGDVQLLSDLIEEIIETA